MITIYGSHKTSAGRCYVMLEECGLNYKQIIPDMGKREHKAPDYLQINPNGKVPTLKDGNFVIWESISINRYLAEKYKPELLGSTVEERSLIDQWSVWSMTELQPPMVDLLIQTVFVPAERRDQSIIDKAKSRIPDRLKILDHALANRSNIVSSQFTLADLNLASVAKIGLSLGYDYKEYPHLTKWLMTMTERASFRKVAAMQ